MSYPPIIFLEGLGFDDLCDALNRFCADENLPSMSADEIRCIPNLTDDQKEWLDAFIEEWEAMMDDLAGLREAS